MHSPQYGLTARSIRKRKELRLRVIVAGSRRITSYEAVARALDNSPFSITVLLSGGSKGVDTLAEAWARKQGIPIERFPLNWKLYRKSAPLIRNCEMAKDADAFLALWDGYSSGTVGMIYAALHYHLHLHVVVSDL